MGIPDTKRTMEFVRPVTSGADTLMAKVRAHGFGIRDDLRRGVLLPQKRLHNQATIQPAAAGRPRFREYNYEKIQLPFLRYTAKPTKSGYKPNLSSLENLLNSHPKRPKTELARLLGSVPEELRHIALAFDSPDEQSATAVCGDLTIESARDKKGFELLLGIKNPERFRREGDVFNQKFATRRNIEPLTRLDPLRDFAIPLAWFDISVSLQERNQYLEGIGVGLMNNRPLGLGQITWYVKQGSAAL